ncbi:amidohydrolase family protein [Nonomuraea sp. FMUSA5-5]|uniref:Amidohydrolase family protein n=1 Tax=Nonomuraea composti TaxID=2720023 RepID=A0ABX1BII1_9ACTN|nr:amidohydrolase family protein [Nonomuraea sp. FMUSA5-5]NJP94603.1 amidohydrolase family protein [Nonomuraea sp. FMUSA5-5]
MFDLIIKGGRWFDGAGSPSAIRDLGVRGGRVAAVSAEPLPQAGCRRVLDAAGCWVLPGFLDVHTHYDIEVLLSPGLPESVRHGVTTVVLGNCSLSGVYCSPDDAADLFSRVEALPHAAVLDALKRHRSWSGADEYVRALLARPLGPNVAAFLGHSDLRAYVMGLGRAVGADPATGQDLDRMAALLDRALDAGFLGLSTVASTHCRLDGDRFRSARLPSTFAGWHEYRALHRVLRARGRVLQSAPGSARPWNTLLFLLAGAGLWARPRLKTSLLAALDSKTAPVPAGMLTRVTALANRLLGAEVRWQHLPVPYELYADGIDLGIFEEFGATAAALHLRQEAERARLLSRRAYRRWFRRDYDRRFRHLYDAGIVACPDEGLVGRSFGEVAGARRRHPAETFLDLVVAHGSRLRWRTTIANDRPHVLDRLAGHPAVQMGFAESGAHLRNMAHYNAPLRLLQRVVAAQAAGRPFMTVERAVHRLTGEPADWFGLRAGTLRAGDRADLVVVDPAGLDDRLAAYHEAPMPDFGGVRRMVNRSDAAVRAVCVAGEPVFERGVFAAGYGSTRRTGTFLGADRRCA